MFVLGVERGDLLTDGIEHDVLAEEVVCDLVQVSEVLLAEFFKPVELEVGFCQRRVF